VTTEQQLVYAYVCVTLMEHLLYSHGWNECVYLVQIFNSCVCTIALLLSVWLVGVAAVYLCLCRTWSSACRWRRWWSSSTCSSCAATGAGTSRRVTLRLELVCLTASSGSHTSWSEPGSDGLSRPLGADGQGGTTLGNWTCETTDSGYNKGAKTYGIREENPECF